MCQLCVLLTHKKAVRFLTDRFACIESGHPSKVWPKVLLSFVSLLQAAIQIAANVVEVLYNAGATLETHIYITALSLSLKGHCIIIHV